MIAIEAGCRQYRGKLTATGRGCLKTRTPIVLAAADVGELRHQCSRLGSREGPHARLLPLQPKAALAYSAVDTR